MKPGIYPSITNEDYHGADGLSSTKIKALLNPHQYYYEYVVGLQKQSRALDFGTAFHEKVLEPDLFEKKYISADEIPKFDGRTKEGKILKKEWEKKHGHKITLSNDDLVKLNYMHDELSSHDNFYDKIVNGKKEVGCFWEEEINGEKILCKFKADSITEDGILVDLKTTTNASYDKFSFAIYDYGYYISAAWYSRGYEKVFGEKPKGFVFAACQKVVPFSSNLYELDETNIETGWNVCIKSLNNYLTCLKTGEYPKKKEPTLILMPGWALDKIDQEILDG